MPVPLQVLLVVLALIAGMFVIVYFATDSHLIRNPFTRGLGTGSRDPKFTDALDFAMTLPRWRRARFVRRWGNEKMGVSDAIDFQAWWQAKTQLGG